jgi:hypothetical protein
MNLINSSNSSRKENSEKPRLERNTELVISNLKALGVVISSLCEMEDRSSPGYFRRRRAVLQQQKIAIMARYEKAKD